MKTINKDTRHPGNKTKSTHNHNIFMKTIKTLKKSTNLMVTRRNTTNHILGAQTLKYLSKRHTNPKTRHTSPGKPFIVNPKP